MSAVVFSAIAATAANGTVYDFSAGKVGQNSAAGQISSIHSTFDNATDMFTWDVTYSNGVAKDTDGYWLVVSNGPNPKGVNDQLAIIYFDASTSLANPTVSIYRYNGVNSSSSFLTPADLLASSKLGGNVITASGSDSNGTRTFNLKVNAAAINDLVFPNWEGIQFGKNIGIWFHTVAGLTTAYDKKCGLTKFDFCYQGWYDAENECTKVPEPGAVALLGMGGVLVARRRRK